MIKGGTNMARNKVIFGEEVLIDLTSDTVTAGTLLSGYTAHDSTGSQITGTYDPTSSVSYQEKSITPSSSEQIVMPDSGYNYLSKVTVSAIPYSETSNSAGGITVTIG